MSPLAGLDAHAQRLAGTSLASLIEDDPARARDFSLRGGPLYANFARQYYDREALQTVHRDIVTLANAEVLPAHGEAVTARFDA